nr:unnamed protein product [Digitaria exilis]
MAPPPPPPPPPTHLCDLPDDLLQHILDFTPSREAASTSVLSRRWRGLWPTPSGAVILDTRSYGHVGGLGVYNKRRDAFFRGAGEAIAAAHHGSSVRTLAVHVDGGDDPDAVEERFFAYRSDSDWTSTGCRFHSVHDVLRHPSTRGVVELTVAASSSDDLPASAAGGGRIFCDWKKPFEGEEGMYKLRVDAVPSQALRVLHVTNCSGLDGTHHPATAAVLFPCLEVLRLCRCDVSLDSLQDMVVASPRLTTLHLERVFIRTKFHRLVSNRYFYQLNWDGDEDEDEDDDDQHEDYDDGRVGTLCCPGVTTVVVLNCSHRDSVTIELDVPMVQVFRYKGYIHRLVLTSPPRDVRRADLHFLDRNVYYTRDLPELFWLFVKNFSNAKVLKLKLDFPIGDVAVGDKERYNELMGETLFCNLDILEMGGQQHRRKRKGAGVAIGNLLQCCPAVRDLRLYLNTVKDPPNKRRYSSHRADSERSRMYLDREVRLDFHRSVDHFIRRRDPVVSANKVKVSDIPGLTDKCFLFNCLRFYLRRVTLQFDMDKANCFGVQLVKFFFEKGMVLEEMYIDDGNKKLWDHMHRKISGSTSSQPCSEWRRHHGWRGSNHSTQRDTAAARRDERYRWVAMETAKALKHELEAAVQVHGRTRCRRRGKRRGETAR